MSTKKSPLELIDDLAGILVELGWVAAIPMDNDLVEGMPRGIICGEPQFAADVAKAYWGDQVDIVDPNASDIDLLTLEDNHHETQGSGNEEDSGSETIH